MNERLLVMNGRTLLETASAVKAGEWDIKEVGKAGTMKAGIYSVIRADTEKSYEGVVVHADRKSTYQEIGKLSLVRHDSTAFKKAPELNANAVITYNAGQATATPKELSQALTR